MQLVNHGIPESVFESVFKGISDFFDPTGVEDRRKYEKRNPTDKIRWGLRSSPGENREYLKVVAHPHYHCPPNPPNFRYVSYIICVIALNRVVIHMLYKFNY